MIDTARRYLSEGVSAGRWLYFGGQPGCGKTHLCTAVAGKLLYERPLLYVIWPQISKKLKGREPMQQLKEDHALQLPDSQSKAEYLASEMRESDVEVLRASLIEDIHKLSLVPDLSDKNFAVNASGVAMRYKLLGFEQLTRIKERWFAEGLRARLKLYVNYLMFRSNAAPLDVADVRIAFTHALPVNLQENAQVVQAACNARAVSTETAVRMLHSGDEWTDADVAKEVAAIRAESAEAEKSALQQDDEDAEVV